MKYLKKFNESKEDKSYYIKLFTKAIKKCDKACDGYIECDISDMDDDNFYFVLSYTIDDRIERGYDEDVEKLLKKKLGKEYDARIDRIDSYPNGTAYYKAYFSKNIYPNEN